MNIFTIICKRLDDAARELRISRYSKLAKKAAQAAQTDRFCYWHNQMCNEVMSRTDAQVKRMERKRGLSHGA